MKTQILIARKADFTKVVLMASTAGALATSPLLTSSVQAGPPSHVPAHGYYKNKDKNKNKDKKNKDWKDRDRDGYDDRDRDRDGRINEREDDFEDRDNDGIDDRREGGFIDRDRDGLDDRYDNDYNDYDFDRTRALTTYTGTVVRNLVGNRFEIRASNGVTYRVESNRREPIRLTVGDEVAVRGYIHSNDRVIVAQRVVITRDRNQNRNGSRVNFPGTVTDLRSDREMTVRGDNGRTYTVRADNRFSSRISRGDRVRIVGRVSNGLVIANNVVLTRDDNNSNGNIRFEGRVLDVSQLFGRRFMNVRANNGTTYRVLIPNNTRYERGDRVRVVGRLQSDAVIAEDIDRL